VSLRHRLRDSVDMLVGAVRTWLVEPAPEISVDNQASQTATSEYAHLLLSEAREEVGRADLKASILLAAAGVGLAAIVQGLVGSGWKPGNLGQPWTAVWWIATTTSMAGLFCLVQAVLPRTKASGVTLPHHVFYFENAAAFSGTAELQAALLDDETSRLHRAAHQLWHVSRIVRRKYRWIRGGIWLLQASVALGLAAVIGSDWG
jgi:Family of unknown function (DUF5706)